MINFVNYGWCVVGIVISVTLPILWDGVNRYFPKPSPAGAASPKDLPAAVDLWKIVAPYVVLGLASTLTALLIFAFAGDAIKDFKTAMLAGYAWDSTLQKLRR
jgi:hypothetical protein